MADTSNTPTNEPGGTPEPTPEALAEQALQAANAAVDAIRATADATSPLNLPDFNRTGESAATPTGMELLNDVNLQVKVELGRTRMLIEDILRLNADSVIELDKAAGDPVDIYINGRHIARGEVLVLNENFCVRISEIIQPTEGLAKAG